MGEPSSFRRRGFVKLCAATAAGLATGARAFAAQAGAVKRYERVRIVDERERPITAAGVPADQCYVFNYPYVSTPCFLIDLGRPAVAETDLRTEDGHGYAWRGGIGPRNSVVAFCAICAHKMSHPARSVSFINYRADSVDYRDRERRPARRGGVIYCCSENSVYDPSRGARVLGGPAKQPLAAIALDEDPDGTLVAVGTCGGELYEAFFDRFGFRLALESGTSDIRRRATGTAVALPDERYSETQVLC